MNFHGIKGLLPLRGRWLRYFLLAVVLALPVSAAVTAPLIPRDGPGYCMAYNVSLWDVLHRK